MCLRVTVLEQLIDGMAHHAGLTRVCDFDAKGAHPGASPGGFVQVLVLQEQRRFIRAGEPPLVGPIDGANHELVGCSGTVDVTSQLDSVAHLPLKALRQRAPDDRSVLILQERAALRIGKQVFWIQGKEALGLDSEVRELALRIAGIAHAAEVVRGGHPCYPGYGRYMLFVGNRYAVEAADVVSRDESGWPLADRPVEGCHEGLECAEEEDGDGDGAGRACCPDPVLRKACPDVGHPFHDPSSNGSRFLAGTPRRGAPRLPACISMDLSPAGTLPPEFAGPPPDGSRTARRYSRRSRRG